MPLPRFTFSRFSITRFAKQGFGGETALLVAQKLVFDRNVGAFLDLAGEADGENLQTIRRAAVGGDIRQAATDLMVQPVDLIAEDVAIGAEKIAIVDAGIGEGPVVGPIDRKTTSAARRAAAPSGIYALGGAQAEGQRTRAADLGRFPCVGRTRDVVRLVDRIFRARSIFIANLPPALVLQPGLPHEVAGKARRMSAALDIVVDGITHFPGPVFIMADEDNAFIAG